MDRLERGPLSLPVSPGEFFDRLTILWVKLARIQEPYKREQLLLQRRRLEAVLLGPCMALACPKYRGPRVLQPLVQELFEVNLQLWDIEDNIRELDSDVFPVGTFDDLDDKEIEDLQSYLSLARSVYVTNSRRGELKAEINKACGRSPEIQQYKEFNRGEEEPAT